VKIALSTIGTDRLINEGVIVDDFAIISYGCSLRIHRYIDVTTSITAGSSRVVNFNGNWFVAKTDRREK